MPTPRDEQHTEIMAEGIASTSRLLGIDRDYTISGEMDPNQRYLTPAKALACLRVVREYLGPDCDPKLYRDHEGPYWNISYEGGPEEWAYKINQPDAVTWPSGVHVETLDAAWCITLHPAPDPAASSQAHLLAQSWDNAVQDGRPWLREQVGAEMAKFLREL